MKIKIFIVLLSFLTLLSCKDKSDEGIYLKIQGFTQGTTYVITYQSEDSININPMIDSLLHDFDMSLSTYIPNSIISLMNSNDSFVVADQLFTEVWNESFRVYEITDGLFDITVGPLINAWGFGPGMKLEMDSMVIDSLMQYVGMNKISLVGGRVIKEYPEIQMDVNAIAQGYSVDIVAKFLKGMDINNFLINIGGEIRCAGKNPGGNQWKIGVDKPIFGNLISTQDYQVILELNDLSMASSGNYRKYYEVDGKKIVHTLDPKTGYTKMNQLLGATILTADCMTADALATACMVMGPGKAKEFISGLKGVEAYFVLSDDDGIYQEWYTPGLARMISK